MQRLIEFKNELEGMIEEQNQGIEDRTAKIEDLETMIQERESDQGTKDEYIVDLEKQL